MAKLKGKFIDDDTIAEEKLDISNAPTDGYILQYKDSTDKLTWIANTTDAHDVIVSANDTTPGFLNGKLVADSGKTTLTENDNGSNETLTIGIGTDIFDKSSDDTDDISEGDNKFVTSTDITNLSNLSGTNSGDEVVATGSEVDTGTDNVKMVTSKAVKDSKVSYTDGEETLTNKTLTSPKINEDVALTTTATTLNLISGYTAVETTLTGGTTTLARSDAIKTYCDNIIAAADAMTYKGATDCSGNPNYPAADAGDTYKVSVAGKIGGAAGEVVEVGDMFICLADSTASGDQAAVGASWNILQVNIDGAVIGPSSATSTNIAAFDGTSGTLIADSGILTANVFDKSSDDTDDISEGDAKFVTASDITVLGNTSGTNSGDEVVATGAEVNTGTDDEKMVTPKAMADSKYITSDGSEALTNKTIDANGTGNSISNIDVADLADGTDGELITWDAAGSPAVVAAGTATHVLTSNGAGAAPTFQALSLVGARRIVEIVTLDATDISNKYNDDLTQVPSTATSVSVCPAGGILQEYGVDFTVITDGADIKRINWSGLGLETPLAEGDKLIVTYSY